MVLGLRTAVLAVASALVFPSAVQAAADLESVLATQANLTTFRSLVKNYPDIFRNLPKDVTIAAPNDAGFYKFLGEWEKYNSTMITASMKYHILTKTISMSSIEKGDSVSLSTELAEAKFANVTGGQRLILTKQPGGEVVFTSGFATRGTVVVENLAFEHGLVQVIDSVMRIPETLESTARGAYTDLTAFVGALYAADMIDEVAAQKDITIFAPRNAAFQQLAGTFAAMDKATLQRTLRYHLVPNRLAQVWELKNASTLTAAAARAPPLLVTRHANAIFVNAAEIIQSGILIANGVVHILDNVLNPAVNGSRPDVTRTAAQPPVFRATGATDTGTTVPTPFTSYLPCTVSCPVTSETATTTETTSRRTTSAAATGKSTNAGVAAARCTGLVGAGVGVGLAVGAMVVVGL